MRTEYRHKNGQYQPGGLAGKLENILNWSSTRIELERIRRYNVRRDDTRDISGKKKNSEVDKRKKYTVTKLKNTKNKRMS